MVDQPCGLYSSSYTASYSATYNPEYTSATSFDTVTCFNVALDDADKKTSWHITLDKQYKAFGTLFDGMFTSGSQQLAKTVGSADEHGASKECRIGYSASSQLDALKDTFAPDALKQCHISDDALVIFGVQRTGICDLSPDGILLPGISQIVTITHGYAIVVSHR